MLAFPGYVSSVGVSFPAVDLVRLGSMGDSVLCMYQEVFCFVGVRCRKSRNKKRSGNLDVGGRFGNLFGGRLVRMARSEGS